MRHLSLWILLANLVINAWGVPGLERTWKSMHPDSEVSCFSCHQTAKGEDPAMKNVTEQGRKNYMEIMLKRKANLPAFKPFLPLPQVDLDVFGDSRSDLDTNREIVKQICADAPKIVLHTGDMVANGSSSSQWNALVPIYECLIEKKNFYPACGNHEGNGCTHNVIRDSIKNNEAYYLLENSGYTFIALDSNNITSAEIKWLKALPKGKKYIPFFHHPAYPILDGHSPSQQVKRRFIPEFKRLGVKLVFAGHNHGYDRNLEDGIVYITSGGGGAPLYPCGNRAREDQACVSDYHYVRCSMEPNAITCQAKLIDGSIVDAVTVAF